MDTAFTHLLAMLGGIADPRRAEGKLYGLPHVFLFSILAVMAGANSYRAIHSFIDVHLHRLKETFELNWRRAPAYTTVRGILQGLAAADVEKVFRLHAQILNESAAWPRSALIVCVRWRTRRSRVWNSIALACCSSPFTATKRMVGRCAASQIASASAASFFCRFTNGFT